MALVVYDLGQLPEDWRTDSIGAERPKSVLSRSIAKADHAAANSESRLEMRPRRKWTPWMTSARERSSSGRWMRRYRSVWSFGTRVRAEELLDHLRRPHEWRPASRSIEKSSPESTEGCCRDTWWDDQHVFCQLNMATKLLTAFFGAKHFRLSESHSISCRTACGVGSEQADAIGT